MGMEFWPHVFTRDISQYIFLTSRCALQYAPNRHVWIVLVLSSMTGSMLLRRTDENLVDEVIEENVELTKEVTKR